MSGRGGGWRRSRKRMEGRNEGLVNERIHMDSVPQWK
jgi:hypothetical protein